MKINSIELENGHIMLVEVLDIELPSEIVDKTNLEQSKSNFPKDATEISMPNIKLSMQLFQEDLKSIVSTIEKSFQENKPDEFSVEMNFGFSAKGGVPLLVSAKSNATIKIKATWKKDKSNG